MKQNWTYKKLGEMCQTCSGGTPSKSHSEYYDGGTIPWLRSGEVSQGLIYKTELAITEEGLKNSSAKIVPPDTVSITMYGATIGEVGIIKIPMCTNQAICNILPSNEIVPAFLRYYLMGQKKRYISMAAGGAQPNISQDLIRRTLLPIVSKSLQQSIVAELDEINNLLSLKRKELDAYDKLAQSLFYEMFGDPVDNEKGWEVNSMPNVCSIIDGDRGTNYPKQDEFHENGYCLFLNAKNVTSTGFNFESCSFITKEKDEILRKGKLNRGDVVLTTRGTIGNLAYYDNSIPYDNVRINSGMVILRMDKTVIHEVFYIKQFSFHLNNIKRRIASGSAQPQLPISTMNKIKLIIPPLSLQQTFATRIEAIEVQKANVKAAIEKLETLLAARMQYWFE